MNRLNPYRLPENYNFCAACGMPIQETAEFCDERCKRIYISARRPRMRRKYGPTGYIYDYRK